MTEPSRYFAEDLSVGAVYDLGEYLITQSDIVSFGQLWDPQPFHVDEQAAAGGHFGGIIASGIQTVGVFQRLAVLAVFQHWQILAGRSLRDIVFLSPVRPDMTLRAELTIDKIDLSRRW